MSYTPVGVDACGAVRVAERVTGIEPALSAWEADVLPLNYTRVTVTCRFTYGLDGGDYARS